MQEVINRIQRAGYESYLVGGAVRDLVLNQKPRDLDLFTTAPLHIVKQLFNDAKIVEVRKDKGTLLLKLYNIHYEISTYRTSMKDIKNDVQHRDFTMNSLLYDGKEIIDLVGGIQDIENKTIKTLSRDRFLEDPLRILRALRFASELGFEIEDNTQNYLYETKDLLKSVAKERIFKELKLLTMGKYASTVIQKYVDILGLFIPELKMMEHFDQKNPHHAFDLLKHTCKVISHTPQDETLRLAALFHDFGKLDTFSIDDEGIGHFYNHEKRSAFYASYYLKKFKAEKKLSEDVTQLVLYHGRDIHPSKKAIRRLLLKLDEHLFLKLIDLKKADKMGKKDEKTSLDVLDPILKIYQELKDEEGLLSLYTLKINGEDLLKMGLKQGPVIGDILNEILELVLDEKLENDRDALKNYVRMKISKGADNFEEIH